MNITMCSRDSVLVNTTVSYTAVVLSKPINRGGRQVEVNMLG